MKVAYIALCFVVLVNYNTVFANDDDVPGTFEPVFTPSESVALIKFDDNKWVTTEDLKFEFGEYPYRISIVVPAGFVNDTTSVYGMRNRRILNNSSILHDYLYWVQPCEGKIGYRVANKIMKQTLKMKFRDIVIPFSMKLGVQVGGLKAWKKNRKLKQSGHTRFASKYINPVYWDEIKESTWEDFSQKNNLKQVDLDLMVTDSVVCDVFLKWRKKQASNSSNMKVLNAEMLTKKSS